MTDSKTKEVAIQEATAKPLESELNDQEKEAVDLVKSLEQGRDSKEAYDKMIDLMSMYKAGFADGYKAAKPKQKKIKWLKIYPLCLAAFKERVK